MTASDRLYDPRTENAGLEAELGRLAAQAQLGWEAERRRFTGLAIARDAALLELGCGPGFATERLRELVPAGTITGLDNDREMLDHARRRLAADPQIEFIHGDAAATGLPDACFDVVVSRYLFQHLADPMPVAREALRLLRPGGLHIVVDVDDGMWGAAEPAFAKMQEIHTRAAAAQGAAGRNRLVGRRLWSILTQAGYAGVDTDVFCYHSDQLGLDAFMPQLDPARLLPLVDGGGLSMNDFLAAHYLVREFRTAPGAHVILLGFIGSGRKPA